MTQSLMRTETDCGIVALKNAAEEAGYNFTYEQIAQAMDFTFHNDLRDDLKDSPLHHEAALRKLRIGSRVVTDDQILAGQTKQFHTVVLIHSPESPIFAQHWVNAGGMSNIKVLLWWNNEKVPSRWVTFQELKNLYRKGFPNAAYEVGKQFPVRGLQWWKRAYLWFINKLF